MGVIENMKDIADLIKKAGDIELYKKMVESEGEVIELTRQKRQLEEKVVELERTLALKKQMNFKAPFYYQDGDEVPFCPACWEANQKAVHVRLTYDSDAETRWKCTVCKQMYLIKKQGAHPPRENPGPPDPLGWMR